MIYKIPDFLDDMKMLTLINLRGNPKLNLTVPDSIQQRITNKYLTLIIDEIQSSEKPGIKFPLVAILESVACVITLLAIFTICFIFKREKQRSSEAPSRVNSENRSSNQSIGTKERKLTYSELLKMTNNFERVLGKGGYGRVYYGNLNGTQVAVKVLFHSSADQDYKHFKAEVELLLRVHHRHLVGLVGYCDDCDNLALIYEYMANRDLKENMYHRTNLLSEKTDVYSFGVVLLEFITNQPVIDRNREKAHITEWVGFMLMEGDIRNIIDLKLMGELDKKRCVEGCGVGFGLCKPYLEP